MPFNRCPITYQILTSTEHKYSKAGLNLLSRNLTDLKDFPYSQAEQLQQARAMASKLSIQGVQPKFSAKLNTAAQQFDIIQQGGTFIIKPQNQAWPYLPENEDLTMRLAATIGLEVPLHGLMYCKDDSLSYWIRRFDRTSLKSPLTHKLALEDFAQLSMAIRSTKYSSSMEQVASIINKFCTFPAIENEKLFKLVIFSYLIGNEDMHLKNFSLITRNGIVSISPAYDLLSTTVAMGENTIEELALPLNGKKNKLSRDDFVTYYATDRLKLSPAIITTILEKIESQLANWSDIIETSFLPSNFISEYKKLLKSRSLVIF